MILSAANVDTVCMRKHANTAINNFDFFIIVLFSIITIIVLYGKKILLHLLKLNASSGESHIPLLIVDDLPAFYTFLFPGVIDVFTFDGVLAQGVNLTLRPVAMTVKLLVGIGHVRGVKVTLVI